MTATATISARRLQNAAARRSADQSKRGNVILAKLVSGTLDNRFVAADDDFTIDAYGRKVRVSKPTDKEIAYALRGNRVLDSIDLNELLGPDTITKLIGNGSLKRSANHNKFHICNTYWITKRAAELYDIPAYVLMDGTLRVDLVD